MTSSRIVIAVALLAMLACATAAEANWRAEPESAKVATSGRYLLGDEGRYNRHDYKEKKHYRRCYYKCYRKKCDKRWGYHHKCHYEEVDCKHHHEHKKQHCY